MKRILLIVALLLSTMWVAKPADAGIRLDFRFGPPPRYQPYRRPYYRRDYRRPPYRRPYYRPYHRPYNW